MLRVTRGFTCHVKCLQPRPCKKRMMTVLIRQICSALAKGQILPTKMVFLVKTQRTDFLTALVVSPTYGPPNTLLHRLLQDYFLKNRHLYCLQQISGMWLGKPPRLQETSWFCPVKFLLLSQPEVVAEMLLPAHWGVGGCLESAAGAPGPLLCSVNTASVLQWYM